MENNNQEQVKPRRSQRQRKFVDRLQLEGRRRKSKPIDYQKHRRQREQKAAEKRKRDFEAISLDSQQKSKKPKLEDKKPDKVFSVPQYNYDAGGKSICLFCQNSFDHLPSPNFCGQLRCKEEMKKFEENLDFHLFVRTVLLS